MAILFALPVVVPLANKFPERPDSRERFMHGRLTIRASIAASGPAEHEVLSNRVNNEAGLFCLSQHPFEGDLGEPALGLGVPPANVAMHARKPNLFEVFQPSVW